MVSIDEHGHDYRIPSWDWTAMMLEANIDPYDLSLPQLIEYLVNLELVDAMAKKVRERKAQEQNKNNPSNKKCKRNNNKDEDQQKQSKCPHCGKMHRGECWYKNKKPEQPKSDKRHSVL